jgi:AAA domain-containing protein
VRGKGGWFVAPGAVRRDGAVWRTLDGTPPLAQAYRDRAIPKLCDKLATIIRAPKQNGGNGATPLLASTSATSPNWQQQATARERAFAAAALTNLAAQLAATAPGQRNRKLYDCAFRLGTMIVREWIDRVTVANALWASCRSNGLVTDDGDDSVQATLASGFKDGTACPHEDLKDHDDEKPNADKPSLEKPNDRLATLRMVTADALEMRGVEWLWPGRFALGKIGLIAGLPDYGKGQIAAFLAAAVTAGPELPCGEGATPQGNVIWLNAEDDARDTIKPRLVAAGADTKRVHFVNGTRRDGVDKTFNLIADLPLLRDKIKQIGNVVLIIIDPVSAYLGVGKVDTRSQSDVRGVLTPLKELAEETGVAVIGIAFPIASPSPPPRAASTSRSMTPKTRTARFSSRPRTTLPLTTRHYATASASEPSAATLGSTRSSTRPTSSGTHSTSSSQPTMLCKPPPAAPLTPRRKRASFSLNGSKPDPPTPTISSQRRSRTALPRKRSTGPSET